MKKIALLLFVSIHSYTYPMMSVAEHNLNLANFGAILEQKIFTIPSLCCAYSCLKDAAITINALAKTNVILNKFINQDDNSLALIKQLSQQFDCPNIDVARALCTQAANNRYALQRAFLVEWGCPWDAIKKDINKLHRIGLDLNFSYGKQFLTPLIKVAARQAAEYSNIAVWLIENGADITCCTPDGKNASMIALEALNDRLIDTLIDHPACNVNHQDNNKNTPLHCCFRGIFSHSFRFDREWRDKKGFPFVHKAVTKLLEKGANPTVINKDGKAPLDLAKELDYQLDLAKELDHQLFVELLEKATANLNFKISINGVS